MIPTVIRPFVLPVTAGIVALGIGGAIANVFFRPPVETRTETKSSTEATKNETANAELTAIMRQLVQQNQSLEQRIAAAETRQADTQTRTVERIERFMPSSAAPGPSVVVVPGQPQPPSLLPANVSRDPVEIITRTIEAIDKSRTETKTDTAASAKTETMAKTEMATTAKVETTAEMTTKTETSAKSESKPVSERDSLLGVGITSQAAPFASYDLAKLDLGPRAFKLGRLGAGLFVTKRLSGGDVDGGPQINLSLRKSRVFGLIGYQIREKTPVVGVGIRF